MRNKSTSQRNKRAPFGGQDAHLKTAINDYTVLAFSSKRAGKLEVEASAYIALAVVYDNQGNLKKGCTG